MKEFDGKKMKNRLINWIKKWFQENGSGCKAIKLSHKQNQFKLHMPLKPKF